MKKIAAIFLLLCCLTYLTGCGGSAAISGKYDPEGALKNADYFTAHNKDTLYKEGNITKSDSTYALKKSTSFINSSGEVSYCFDKDGNLKSVCYSASDVAFDDFKDFCAEFDSAFSKSSISLFVLPEGSESKPDLSYIKTLADKKDTSFICSGTWFDNGMQISMVYSYMAGGSPSMIVTINKGE